MARLSFFSWSGIGEPTFVGLANYERMLSDDRFWNALQHTLIWATFGLALPIGFALLLAVLVEDAPIRGKQFFRSLFFVPQVISIAVAAVIWSVIFEPTYGLLNNLLQAVGLESLTRSWLGDSDVSLAAVIFTWAWHFFPFAFVIYVAGLQSVDRTLYDAARIDRAGPLRIFWHVTLPQLKRTHAVVLSIGLIASMRPFAVVWAMTQGGPYYATDVLPTMIYSLGFVGTEVGYAASISAVLALMTIVMSLVFIRLRDNDGDA